MPPVLERGPRVRLRSSASRIAALAARTASGGIAAILAASSSAASTVAAAGTTPGDEAAGVGLLCGHRPAGQDQLHRAGLADRPGQALGAAGAGHDPEPDLRLAEARVVAGHDHVAGHRQLAAAAKGEAADRGDERQPDGGDAVPGVEPATGGQRRRRLRFELTDVGPGRERPIARAGDDDRPAGRVGVERLERRRRARRGARSSAR